MRKSAKTKQLAALSQCLIILAIMDKPDNEKHQRSLTELLNNINNTYPDYKKVYIKDIISVDALQELERIEDIQMRKEFLQIVLSFLKSSNGKMMSDDKKSYMARILQALDK